MFASQAALVIGNARRYTRRAAGPEPTGSADQYLTGGRGGLRPPETGGLGSFNRESKKDYTGPADAGMPRGASPRWDHRPACGWARDFSGRVSPCAGVEHRRDRSRRGDRPSGARRPVGCPRWSTPPPSVRRTARWNRSWSRSRTPSSGISASSWTTTRTAPPISLPTLASAIGCRKDSNRERGHSARGDLWGTRAGTERLGGCCGSRSSVFFQRITSIRMRDTRGCRRVGRRLMSQRFRRARMPCRNLIGLRHVKIRRSGVSFP